MLVIPENLTIVQIVSNLLFNLCRRQDSIEPRLGIAALLRPDAMSPVHILDGTLISDAIGESKCSVLGLCRQQCGPCTVAFKIGRCSSEKGERKRSGGRSEVTCAHTIVI